MITRIELRTAEQAERGRLPSTTTPEVSVGYIFIDFGGFQKQLIREGWPWRGVLTSLLLHSVLSVCGMIALRLDGPPAERPLRYRVTMQPTLRRVELPHINMRRAVVQNANSAPPRSMGRNSTGAAPSVDTDEGGRRRLYREFQLPDQVRRVESHQTLIQPESPPEVVPPHVPRLPEFLFWRAEVSIPRQRKPLVLPGRKTTSIDQPQLAAPPQLRLPPMITAADQGAAPAVTHSSALTLPPSAAPPVRMFRPLPRRDTASADMYAEPGDAAAMLALNPNPQPSGGIFEIAAGNQIGKLPPPGMDSANGQRVLSAVAGASRLNGPGGSESPIAGAPSESSPNVPRNSAGADAASDSTGAGLLNGAVPIRHVYPENGQFDIVVAQAFAEGDASDRLLSGQPVYTVYLRIGNSQEWILRYCAAESSRPVQSANVVMLDNPAPLKAPYPRVTVSPGLPQIPGKPFVLRGFLTVEGAFRDLESADQTDSGFVRVLQPYLRQWAFRPATRDGRPIELEIVLVVPRFGV